MSVFLKDIWLAMNAQKHSENVIRVPVSTVGYSRQQGSWCPHWSYWSQMGPMWATRTLLSGILRNRLLHTPSLTVAADQWQTPPHWLASWNLDYYRWSTATLGYAGTCCDGNMNDGFNFFSRNDIPWNSNLPGVKSVKVDCKGVFSQALRRRFLGHRTGKVRHCT